MIDERKIKRELSGLARMAPEGTIEHRIYQIFLAYINRQTVIDFMTLRFYERMGKYLALVRNERKERFEQFCIGSPEQFYISYV